MRKVIVGQALSVRYKPYDAMGQEEPSSVSIETDLMAIRHLVFRDHFLAQRTK